MSESVIVIGKSGHGKVIADIILSSGDKVLGFLDDAYQENETILGFPLLGRVEDYVKYPDCKFIIAIGNAKIRERIADSLDVSWYTAIHPSAVVSMLDVEIGEGTAVMANAVVNPSAKIGKHCIINTGSVVEHDNILGDYVHISPKAVLAGTVTVGKSTHIGAGAAVINNLTIAANCIIGGGAAVIGDITESGTYVGVPARRKK